MSAYVLDLSQPVELGHPLNFGKTVWLFPVNLSGGLLYNIMLSGETQQAVANHGVLTNAPTWAILSNGQPSNNGLRSLKLASASSQYVDCGPVNGIGTIAQKTVIIRCNPTTLSGGRPLTMPEDDTSTDKPAVIFSLNSGATGGAIEVGGSPFYNGKVTFAATAGFDYHLVASVSSKTVLAYVNGGYIGTATTTTTIAANPKLYIGRYNGNYGQYFNGSVSSVIVYNRAIGPNEIEQEYEQSCRGYIGPDSPLRLISTKSYFPPPSTLIAFDAASNSGYQAAASTYSWSHTCTGSNRYLVVGVSMLSLAQTVSGITYNGVAMSLIGTKNSVSGAARVEMWGLVAPASGSNTIAVTLTGAIASAGNASSYTNVHQTVSTEAFNSAQATNVGAADATVNVTTVADNDWTVDCLATDDTAVTVGAGQTQDGNVTGAGGSGAMSHKGPDTPPGAFTMSWTNVGALATWVIGSVGLRNIAASSSQSYTATTTESLTYSESAARVLSAVHTATDAPTFSDAVTRAFAGSRALTEAPAYSEAVTRTFVGSRAATDAPVFSDTATRIVTEPRSATDAPMFSESVARTFAGARTTTDAPTFSDVATRILAEVRTATDAPTYSDSATRQFIGLRTATAAPTFSDAATRAFVGARTAGEATIYSDSAARLFVGLRVTTESSAYSDSSAGITSKPRAATEAPTFSDAATRTFAGLRTVSEAPQFSDAAARVLAEVRTATDASQFSDSAKRTKVFISPVTDAATFSDTAIKQRAAVGFTTEAQTFLDSAVRSVILSRLCTESLSFSETAIALRKMIAVGLAHFSVAIRRPAIAGKVRKPIIRAAVEAPRMTAEVG